MREVTLLRGDGIGPEVELGENRREAAELSVYLTDDIAPEALARVDELITSSGMMTLCSSNAKMAFGS